MKKWRLKGFAYVPVKSRLNLNAPALFQHCGTKMVHISELLLRELCDLERTSVGCKATIEVYHVEHFDVNWAKLSNFK